MYEQEGPCLMGRNWLSQLKLDWKSLTQSAVHRVDSGTALSKLLAEYDEVFNEELGTIVGYKVRISVMN